jgi:hypothetical protein
MGELRFDMTQATYRGSPMEHMSGGSAPLITLFERDDAIAVPLLSQLRMAGYDVRAARTPVELNDILSKSLVALVLVDLGAPSAGRREFWVQLDALRRGRGTQVITFRFILPHGDLDLDMEPSARAIADIEAHGAHEFQRIIDGVHQRVPLHNASPHAAPGLSGMIQPGAAFMPNGGIQPLGAALGMAPTPFSAQNGHLFNMPGAMPGGAPASWGAIAPLGVSPVASVFEGASAGLFPPSQPLPSMGLFPPSQPAPGMGGYGAPGQGIGHMGQAPLDPAASQAGTVFGAAGAPGASPFASPTPANPFGLGSSPFAQPYQANPFAGQMGGARPPAPQLPPISAMPPMPAAQPAPASPAAQPWQGNPIPPASYPSSYPSGYPSSLPPSTPSSVPPWNADHSYPQRAQSGWPGSGPASLGSHESAPGAGSGYGPYSLPPFGEPPAPAFQDAWSPPDAESDLPTGVVPEIAFQQPISAPRPHSWQEPTQDSGGPLLPPMPDAYSPPRSQLGPEPTSPAPSRALVSTPTEVALGGVLVNGALLTPGRLEALKGIQAMLAGVNLHRKLGDLALMFKFLSPDQLLAAVLVSRGLVTPAQIAYLGRMKKEMAEKGIENDLESLLVSFKMLAAEQLRQIRAELSA